MHPVLGHQETECDQRRAVELECDDRRASGWSEANDEPSVPAPAEVVARAHLAGVEQRCKFTVGGVGRSVLFDLCTLQPMQA